MSNPLIFIEWEDSAQPVPNWVYLSDIGDRSTIICVSVGWLLHDGESVKVLAPNMGNLGDEENVQASGVIRIPTRCIVRIVELDEPPITCPPSASVPSSRPVTELTLQAS